MAQTLSRQVLYDLVWSTPLKQLCERFGISDVALKKTCAKADIPTPERGYWARKEAGKNVQKIALPPRAPGMDDDVVVGGGFMGGRVPGRMKSCWARCRPRRNFPSP